MKKTLQKVLVVAGGTGGHVFPGLVVALSLREQNVAVEWLGTPTGIEAKRIPPTGIPMTLIKVKGVRGMGWKRLLRAPFDVLNAIWISLRLLNRFKPDVVCAMGGFSAGPAGVACLLTGTPLVIEEQNAVGGFTNRILSLWAKRVLLGLPQAQHKHGLHHGVLVGNPLRAGLYQTDLPKKRFGDRKGPLRVLVLGGSQGALALNKLVPEALHQLNTDALVGKGLEVWHQVGPQHLEMAQKIYQDYSINVRLVPFIEDVAEAYSWADLVICRSGALTVSELAAVGVGALLIPFPAAIDDHQTYNAHYLVDRGAAELHPQASLNASLLAERVQALGANRQVLLEMAEKGRQCGYPHSTEIVIKELESVVNL
jgi:UDP-N-acetylglucosamine--N-acetylmuramyl-(pentapeptide) pyrophosphoryl-undecaprenol N-acetylglucosamine transferase